MNNFKKSYISLKRFIHKYIKKQTFDYPQGCLTDKEWSELVSLEYVLIWRYSEDEEKDEKRYRELSEMKWDSVNIK